MKAAHCDRWRWSPAWRCRCRRRRATSARRTCIRPTTRPSRRSSSWASCSQEQSGGEHGRQGLPQRRSRQRARHDRAAEDRRARHDAHQRRAAEQRRAGDHRARPAVPVPLRGAHARRARRAGRRRDPGRDGSAGHGRAGLLRQRRALDVHREEAGQDAGRPQGHEDPRPAVGPVRGDGRGARRQPDADALRRGLHRAEDRHRRRGREQLPVLRILAPLRGGQVLHA